MNKHIERIVKELGIHIPDFECPSIGQTEWELVFGLNAVRLLQPETIVEIGSSTGGHIYLLSAVLDKDKPHRIISIDPWGEDTKYGRNYQVYLDCISALRTAHPNIDYAHIRGESQSDYTTDLVKHLLDGLDASIDYLFIDGCHDEDAVLQDWNNYKGFVSKEGLVCFHDVIGYPGPAAAWVKIVSNLGPDYATKTVNKKGIPLLDCMNNITELGLGYVYHQQLPKEVKEHLES
jgi:predicted O-methyltransferase YrrM